MSAPVEQNSLAISWVSQFEPDDLNAAATLIRSLRLVSFADFEAGIIESVRKICKETTGRVAVFPVDKNPAGTSRIVSSAGKIGYILTSVERSNPKRVRVCPTVESMRSEKVKNIVLVDDLIGTGGRITKFWDRWASKSLKSWLSYKYCTLWVIAYAGHEDGIVRLLERITYLDREHIRLTLPLGDASLLHKRGIPELCDHYSKRTLRSRAARGVGGLLSHVIFQHGCPNNAPAILWSHGPNWRALFPNRAVPPELFSSFDDSDEESRNAEILWSAGQYRLALELINSLHHQTKARSLRLLLTVLGLLARQVSVGRIPQLMTISADRINTAIDRLKKNGLVDANLKPTPFGFDVLERVRRGKRNDSPFSVSSDHAARFYYPLNCFGVQRKSSNEPAKKP